MNSHEEVLSGTELPVVRRSWIQRRIAEAGVVRTQELADELHVSVETIRRDLAALERDKVLERVHGGAAGLGQRLNEEPSFQERLRWQSPAKERIGRAAAALISLTATIFLDVGTTIMHVARALPREFQGIVVTNSLPAAAEVAKCPHAQLLVTGGRVRAGDLAMSGQHAVTYCDGIRADCAFLGSGGVHPVAGLTDFYLDEVATRQAMLRHSAKSYVVADSSKFNRIAPYVGATWDQLVGLITDETPPDGLAAAIAAAGADVIVAG